VKDPFPLDPHPLTVATRAGPAPLFRTCEGAGVIFLRFLLFFRSSFWSRWGFVFDRAEERSPSVLVLARAVQQRRAPPTKKGSSLRNNSPFVSTVHLGAISVLRGKVNFDNACEVVQTDQSYTPFKHSLQFVSLVDTRSHATCVVTALLVVEQVVPCVNHGGSLLSHMCT